MKRNKTIFILFSKFLAVLAGVAVLSSTSISLVLAATHKVTTSAGGVHFTKISNTDLSTGDTTWEKNKASEDKVIQDESADKQQEIGRAKGSVVKGFIIKVKLHDTKPKPVIKPEPKAEGDTSHEQPVQPDDEIRTEDEASVGSLLQDDNVAKPGSQAVLSADDVSDTKSGIEEPINTIPEGSIDENPKEQESLAQVSSKDTVDINEDVSNPDESAGETTKQSTNETVTEETISNVGDLESQDPDNTDSVNQDNKQAADVEITNTNNAQVVNEANSRAETGANLIQGDEAEDGATIESGEVNILANVVNTVNINSLDSELVTVVENFNDLSANVLLNHTETTQAELVAVLASEICSVLLCQNFDSFTLTNTNNAVVENNVQVVGDSGNNKVIGGEEDVTIRTGDVNALVNIINVVNTNSINSVWTIALINIFGDWQGDLVLPSELYFIDHYSLPPGGSTRAQPDQKIILDVHNSNQADIVNNVNLDAQSGNNKIAAVTADGSGGDVEDSQIVSGNIQSQAKVNNVVNTNIVNARWFLGIVNTLGSWSGEIYSLPNQVAMNQTPTGLTFWAISDPGQLGGEVLEGFAHQNASTTQKAVKIVNDNQATVINNVDIKANSGANEITAEEVESGAITTGNVKALANIINFVNTNLINANLYIGLVNVFGDWNGNIVFGYPDLAVSQRVLGEYPTERGGHISYEINYQNTGNASMDETFLEWYYDPSKLELLGVPEGVVYDESPKGTLKFSLGKLAPGYSGSIVLNLNTNDDFTDGAAITNYARIFGTGSEQNTTNNEHLLVSAVGNSNQPISSSRVGSDLLKVQKSNDAQGGRVSAGGEVNFKLIVQNDTTTNLYDAVLYDVLFGPDGRIVATREFPLGTVLPREQVEISYTLEVNSAAPAGTYTNIAYLEGVNDDFVPLRSGRIAFSSFDVVGGDNSIAAGRQARVASALAVGTQGPVMNIEQSQKAPPKDKPTSEVAALETDKAAGISGLLNPNFIIVSSLVALLYAFLAMRRKIIS